MRYRLGANSAAMLEHGAIAASGVERDAVLRLGQVLAGDRQADAAPELALEAAVVLPLLTPLLAAVCTLCLLVGVVAVNLLIWTQANRVFPGSRRGSLAARIAELFMREVASHCSHGIDFHCGSDDRINLPQIRANLADEETLALARAFASPVLLNSKPPKGSLRSAAVRRRKKVLVFEGGEAKRFTSGAIGAGVEWSPVIARTVGSSSSNLGSSESTCSRISTFLARSPSSPALSVCLTCRKK